jgi:signal recognition particle subunit SRP19
MLSDIWTDVRNCPCRPQTSKPLDLTVKEGTLTFRCQRSHAALLVEARTCGHILSSCIPSKDTRLFYLAHLPHSSRISKAAQSAMGKKKGGGVRIKQMGPKQSPPNLNPMEALQIPQEEMVQLPLSPDRSYQVFWPIQESFTMKTEGFQVIYPSYVDSNKSVKEGRRVSLKNSIPCPTVMDLSEALQSMQVRHVIQPYKGYSRDISCQWENPGRIMVDVTNHRKLELLVEMATRMDALPSRETRLVQEAMQKAEEEKAADERSAIAAAAAKSCAPKRITSSTANNKKKGKKGKK